MVNQERFQLASHHPAVYAIPSSPRELSFRFDPRRAPCDMVRTGQTNVTGLGLLCHSLQLFRMLPTSPKSAIAQR